VALGLLVVGYLAIQLLAGARDSPLVPPQPLGTGVPSWAARGARWVGLDRLGRSTLASISLLLLAGLVGAFLLVVREAWARRVALAPVVAAAGVSLLLAVAGPLVLSRDVYSYAAYGRIAAIHGSNPYERTPADFPTDPFAPVVSLEWRQTRSVYGPAFTLASAGIARGWSGSPAGTVLAFKLLAGASVMIAMGLAASACGVLRAGHAPLAAAIVGLNPVIVVHTVGGGHNDALVAALLAGALVMAIGGRRRRSTERTGTRELVATGLLTLAALVKVVAALPLVLWVWWIVRSSRAGRRRRIGATHLSLAAAIAAGVTAPFFAGWRTITAIADLASRQGWASGARLVARGAEALGRAVGGGAGGSALRTTAYAAFLSFFAITLMRLAGRARPSAGGWELWGASLLLFALAAPYLLPWYVAWFVPFLALMDDEGLAWIGVAVGGLLALTSVPAEPGPDPAVWRDMVLMVHYVVAPLMLVLFALAVRRVSLAPRSP
jgi:alpha-1,6-mannosyltransferase